MPHGSSLVACIQITDLVTASLVRDEAAPADSAVATTAADSGVTRVVEASAAARLGGVMPGMTVAEARDVCPGLAMRAVDVEACGAAYRVVLAALRALTPAVEPVDLHHVWVSIDGFAERPDDARAFGRELVERVRRATSAGVRVGIGPGKLTSHVITRYSVSRGVMVLPARHAVRFIGGLPVRDLPLSPDRVEDLLRLGIAQVRDFAALPARGIRARFGEAGWRAYLWAHGWDDSAVRPWEAVPWLRVQRSFPLPTTHRGTLARHIEQLAQRLAPALATHYRFAATLALDIDFDHGAPTRRARPVFSPLARPRLLAEAGADLLADIGPVAPVVRLSLAAQGVFPTESRELALFRRGISCGEGTPAMPTASPAPSSRPPHSSTAPDRLRGVVLAR